MDGVGEEVQHRQLLEFPCFTQALQVPAEGSAITADQHQGACLGRIQALAEGSLQAGPAIDAYARRG